MSLLAPLRCDESYKVIDPARGEAQGAMVEAGWSQRVHVEPKPVGCVIVGE